jgi:RND superfamily putative drug exporter
VKGGDDATQRFAVPAGAVGAAANDGQSKARKLVGGLSYRNGAGRAAPRPGRAVHPVTLWRGRLLVALDALEAETDTDQQKFERRSPVETTHVQLPTGDRLQIPTGAETLRLKGYLIMCRNSSRDYAEFAELVDAMEAETAAVVLAGMDRYYCCQSPKRQWIATQLVRRLADPHPADLDDDGWPEQDATTDWEEVRHRCLSVAVAMLEEAR